MWWNYAQRQDVLSIHMKEHTDLQLHTHSELTIEILGETLTIPADIGIDPQGMRVIHTHDDSGKIHMEAPFKHDFYLRDFFTVWGKRFDQRCIMDYCEDDNHTLTMSVNGVETDQRGDLLLLDDDVIVIKYAQK